VSLDFLFKRTFGDEESTALGSGWASGVLSVLAGAVALGGVLCFQFPEWLTTPAFRSHYSIPLLRRTVQLLLVVSFVSGALSLALRRRKVLGATGIGLCLAASLLGGSSIPLPGRIDAQVGLGLDWFLLNLLLLAAVFVPLERAWPLRPDQSAFRRGWTTDGVHFLVSHIGVQLFSIGALAPAIWLGRRLSHEAWSERVQSAPWAVQFVLIVIVADLAQYWAHRALHRFPPLWRLHAVHHSSRAMDWLAGSRMHPIEALLVRGCVLFSLSCVGFSASAVGAYLVFVSFHAVWIHTNIKGNFAWLEPFLVTPRIHHFHHALEQEAIDKNFAIHLPALDRLFGTRYLPEGQWPTVYGLGTDWMPEGYWAQLTAPFRRFSGEHAAPIARPRFKF
jgi:sterol desaturase/sphingolipid hydroxylase (fatty acid hydroxylase superfamily)